MAGALHRGACSTGCSASTASAAGRGACAAASRWRRTSPRRSRSSRRRRHFLPATMPSRFGALATAVGTTSGQALVPGNTVEPLIDGDQAYPAMIAAIDAASTHDRDDAATSSTTTGPGAMFSRGAGARRARAGSRCGCSSTGWGRATANRPSPACSPRAASRTRASCPASFPSPTRTSTCAATGRSW